MSYVTGGGWGYAEIRGKFTHFVSNILFLLFFIFEQLGIKS